MSKIIAKITILCWGFLLVFVVFLTIAMAIPAGAVYYVSAIAGAAILVLILRNLWRTYRAESFDFGWFLTVGKGFWQFLAVITGACLFAFGAGGLLVPEIVNDLAEKQGMKIAAVFIILFWTALISMFSGWQLVCLSESVGYLRLKKIKPAVGAFAVGILWLGFVMLFLYLFLDVIRDNFFAFNDAARNLVMAIFAVLSVIAGLFGGRFEDLKILEKEDEKAETR